MGGVANGNDLARFPEVAAAVGALPARTLILDGEIAVFDTALVSRSGWLRERPIVAKPFHREGWIWEEKYDGWRMLAYKGRLHESDEGQGHDSGAPAQVPLSSWRTVSRRTLMSNGLPTTGACEVLRKSAYNPASP